MKKNHIRFLIFSKFRRWGGYNSMILYESKLTEEMRLLYELGLVRLDKRRDPYTFYVIHPVEHRMDRFLKAYYALPRNVYDKDDVNGINNLGKQAPKSIRGTPGGEPEWEIL